MNHRVLHTDFDYVLIFLILAQNKRHEKMKISILLKFFKKRNYKTKQKFDIVHKLYF